jgi:hypothetical protein
MSLHHIFDYVWNAPIPWLWILGGFAALWVLGFLIVLGATASK